jgi:hypothetical protein
VGFGREARRVRDHSLPDAYRLHALGSCIQLAQPIGFQATWSYLEVKVGRRWRHRDFLLPAIDMLEAERSRPMIMDAEYARLRGQQKRAGRRSPRYDVVTPQTPRRWHGDEQLGARHALAAWRTNQPDLGTAQHPAGALVLAAVDHALTSPDEQVGAVDELQGTLDWARHEVHVVGWRPHPSAYGFAWTAHFLLGQLHLLAFGAKPLGTPWNFRER